MGELPRFHLVAGHVALDFVNTLDNRYVPERAVDLLSTYADFLLFCQEAGVITPGQAEVLERLDHGTAAALHEARELREALERIFTGVVNRAEMAAADTAILNQAVQRAMRHRFLKARDGGVAWFWTGLEQNASGPLWLIADAAANLLVSDDLKRVRECGNDTCRWLFLDTSKNQSRRWCDMKICGNRIKARNYYQRARKENAGRTDPA